MGQATLVFQVSSVNPAVRIISSPPAWTNVEVGSTVTHQLTAVDGTQPYSWSVVGPAGMTITPIDATSAQLTWILQSVVNTQVTVTVTDAS